MSSTLVQLEDGEFKEETDFPLSFLIISPKLLSDGYTNIDSKEVVVLLLSCVLLFVTPWTPWQHARLLCPPPTPRTCSNSCPLSKGCPPTISSSVFPFSSCLRSFPESEYFLMNQLFLSGGQSIGASASRSCR